MVSNETNGKTKLIMALFGCVIATVGWLFILTLHSADRFTGTQGSYLSSRVSSLEVLSGEMQRRITTVENRPAIAEELFRRLLSIENQLRLMDERLREQERGIIDQIEKILKRYREIEK